MKRKHFLLGVAAGVALLTAPAYSQAPDSSYPSRPLRFVVPFPAGTAPDVIARVLGEQMQRGLGQAVIIDNRPGAAGIIGADYVAKSPPDGYTLFMAVNSIVAINPHVYAKLPYDAQKDFAPVTQLTLASYALITNPSVAATSVPELIALAKARPGTLDYASPGIGSGPHVITALFGTMAGVDMHHVPFKTSGLQEVVAGIVPVSFEPIATAVPMIKAGKVRALAVSSPRRLAALPDVPPVGDTLRGFDGDGWHGVLVPAKTPGAIVLKLNTELVRIVNLPEVRQRLSDLGLTVVGGTPEAFDGVLKSDYERWGRVVKAAKISVE